MSWDPGVAQILSWVSALGVTGLSATGLSTWLFHVFGKAWIEQKFQTELADFTAKKNQDLERLKAELSRFQDRAIKFNAVEFELLPRLWFKLKDAQGRIAECWASLKEWPDFSKMTEIQVREYLKGTTLASSAQEEVFSATNKLEKYKFYAEWESYYQAEQHFREFHNLLVENDIFFDDGLLENFNDLRENLSFALAARHTQLQMGAPVDTELMSSAKAKLTQAGLLIMKIKAEIRLTLKTTSVAL